MEKPSTVVLDANICFAHAMHLGTYNGRPIRDFYCVSARSFVNGCKNKSISIGTFPLVQDICYGKITKVVNDFARFHRVGDYGALKYRDKVHINLDSLFRRIQMYGESFTEAEIEAARQFFTSIQKNIAPFSDPGKDPIPEREDLQIFVCSSNLPPDMVHILSNDSHFTGYAPEIEKSPFGLKIMPLQDLNRIMIEWDWPISG